MARAEVEGGGKFPSLSRLSVPQESGQAKIAAEGLKHVLPWTGGGFVSDRDGLALRQSPNTVGNDAIHRPISASNDVPGPSTGDPDRVKTKERTTPGADSNFCGGFAGAVGVPTAERILLTITVNPFPVLVALIRGYKNGSTRLLQRTKRFQQVDG